MRGPCRQRSRTTSLVRCPLPPIVALFSLTCVLFPSGAGPLCPVHWIDRLFALRALSSLGKLDFEDADELFAAYDPTVTEVRPAAEGAWGRSLFMAWLATYCSSDDETLFRTGLVCHVFGLSARPSRCCLLAPRSSCRRSMPSLLLCRSCKRCAPAT